MTGEFVLTDATPRAYMIRSLRSNAHVTVPIALEELIDNSFDAEATEVAITIVDRSLSVYDNGHGCSDMAAMVILGNRVQSRSTKIGRYGIGLKESSLALGPVLEIESRCGNILYGASMDWDAAQITNEWRFGNRRPEPNVGPSFTRITIPRLSEHQRIPSKVQIATLQQLYTPALLKGKRLLYNKQLLTPSPMPRLSDTIQTFGTYDGRRWKLLAGILRDEVRPWRPGYTIAFRDRLLDQGNSNGTMQYSVRNFFAYVELFEDDASVWDIDRSKHGLVGVEDFLESLYPTVEPLLCKAQAKSHDLKFEKLGEHVSRLLTAVISSRCKAREQRAPRSEHGQSEPKNTGIKREKAEKHDPNKPGSVNAHGSNRGMRLVVEFAALPDKKIGSVTCDRYKKTVTLNKLHSLFEGDPTQEVVATAAVNLFILYLMTHDKFGQEQLFENTNGQILDVFSIDSGILLDSHLRLAKGDKEQP